MSDQKSKSKTKQEEQEGATSRSIDQINSPHQEEHTEPPIDQPKQKTDYKKIGNYSAAFASVCISAYLINRFVIGQDLVVKQFSMNQYRFQVFCPINQIPNYDLDIDFKTNIEHQELRVLTQDIRNNTANDFDGIDKYLIYVKMMNISTEPNSTFFFYCSYVTDWINRDCSKAKPVCTLPGPIFYVQKDKAIDVAWVYNIDYSITNGLAFETVNAKGCYFDSSNHHCKLVNKKQGKQNCTYLDPTNQIPKDTHIKNYILTNKSIGIDVHVHGLQVRPAFDGNPLSWLGADGAIGTGYQSLLNPGYFTYFKDPVKTLLQVNKDVGHIYTKVNRYQNFQPPGNLWYHDHTMHVTKTNVALGMAGDYIIYDQKVNDQLPGPHYQILIVAGELFNNTDNTNAHKIHTKKQKTEHSEGGIRNDPEDVPFLTLTNLTFQRNQTYRIRILNGQWDSIFRNLQFKTQCEQSLVKKHTQYIESCKKTLNFSVIGSDSSIFYKPVHNVNKLTLASAERFQILIIFDGSFPDGRTQNQIDPLAESVILVSRDNNKVIRNFFKLQPNVNQNKNQFSKFPSSVGTIQGLTFYDLNQINTLCKPNETLDNTTMCINTVRMRPMFRDKNFNFFFNGHYDFSQSGASENPKIGTTQDWYLINTMDNINHPIHIHLINFQIIGKTNLRFFKAEEYTCSYYQVDYYRSAKKLHFMDLSDHNICIQLRTNVLITNQYYEYGLKDYDREDEKDPNTLISGKDVLKLASNKSRFVNQTGACKSNYKYQYVCKEPSNDQIPTEYRKWKQVVLLEKTEVLHIRIRWTSIEYNTTERSKPYPYFNVPEDQLIEYPGYVYHCHFLSHEDNELMRPIMMQPSDKFESEYNVTGTPLGDCMQRRGLQNKNGWKARYECINELSGCAA